MTDRSSIGEFDFATSIQVFSTLTLHLYHHPTILDTPLLWPVECLGGGGGGNHCSDNSFLNSSNTGATVLKDTLKTVSLKWIINF